MNGSAPLNLFDTAKNGKVLGAYLLVCGRQDVAARITDLFLQHLFCTHGGCGRCIDCKKVKEGHVDILRLCAPKVDELRGAISFVAEKPYEGCRKAVVISMADGMTVQAANSLLKTLEEPPLGTVFVLSARSVCGVLPTIASRCAVIPLTPSPDATRIIAENLGCDEQAAAVLADLSGGFPEEAQRICGDAGLLARRQETLGLLHKLLMQKNMAISTFADYLELNKEHAAEILCVMLSYMRDIRILKKTQSAILVINKDRLSSLHEAAGVFTSTAIRNMINIILETERRFFFAVNFRLTVEKMLFCILEEKNKWSKS